MTHRESVYIFLSVYVLTVGTLDRTTLAAVFQLGKLSATEEEKKYEAKAGGRGKKKGLLR